MRTRIPILVAVLLTALASAGAAAAHPLSRVSTSTATCPHGTRAVWHVAYESFGSTAFRELDGSVSRQSAPGGGRPDPALTAALRSTADEFGSASGCAVGLRFDVYWSPRHRLAVRQENYVRLTAANLPRPTPAPGGPRTAHQFYGRYDSVMEQFAAFDSSGLPLLGYHFEGETFGYVSLIDSLAPDPSVLTYELLQGMSRFFTTRGGRIAPNPQTYMDAYCSALRRLGYTDIHRVSTTTCISDHYARDVIGGHVPVYHGIGARLWRRYSVSRAWRRHHTLPAGLPAGHGRISSGAGPH